jgi:hypothetical protein
MTQNTAQTNDDAAPYVREHFFERDGSLFVPTRRAVGPWNPNSLHGRVLAGLFARCLEEEYGDEALQFTRLTIDMFRLPSLEPIEVKTEVIREGNRIRVADAVALSEGQEIGRARAVQLRKAEAPGRLGTRCGGCGTPGCYRRDRRARSGRGSRSAIVSSRARS